MLARTSRTLLVLSPGLILSAALAGCLQAPQGRSTSTSPRMASSSEPARPTAKQRTAAPTERPLAKGMGATGGPAGREALRPDKSP